MSKPLDESTAKQMRELLSDPRRSRAAFERTDLSLPEARVRRERDLRVLSVERSEPTAADIRQRSVEYMTVKSSLHQRLLDELDERNLLGSREDQLTTFINEFVAGVFATETVPLNEAERGRLNEDLLEETLGVG